MATKPSTPTPCEQQPSPEPITSKNVQQAPAIHPYFCFGFKVEDEIVYISDVSHIPEDKLTILETRPRDKLLPVLVLDCLRLTPHTSHVGLEGALELARRIHASRTYLTGFSHDVAHDEYVTIGEAIGGVEKGVGGLTETENSGLSLVKDGANLWLRPAHDGLRVFVESDGSVRDETY
jgi:phosphoribosyl 1,2-cyclic phosphodiesterase